MEKINKGDPVINFEFDNPWQNNLDFFKQIENKKVIISFLRYNGCPVCKMEMAEYKRDYTLLSYKNTQLFVVLQSTQAVVKNSVLDTDFPFIILCDPKAILFDLFGVKADFIKFLNPKGLIAAAKATFKGHHHGKFEGKETQMPATFVIDEHKKIIHTHYGKDITDVPKLPSLLKYL